MQCMGRDPTTPPFGPLSLLAALLWARKGARRKPGRQGAGREQTILLIYSGRTRTFDAKNLSRIP